MTLGIRSSLYTRPLFVSTFPLHPPHSFFFFFNDTATTEIYTLSLHDPLPISTCRASSPGATTSPSRFSRSFRTRTRSSDGDRKSTRLNSSHSQISYAVFCLKKKKKKNNKIIPKNYIAILPYVSRAHSESH